MRKVVLGLLLILTMLATSAVFATVASAQELTLQQLRAKLRTARQQQKLASQRAQLASANLSAALALQNDAGAGTLGGVDAAAVDDRVQSTSGIMTTIMADGTVTDDEIAALQKRATAKKRLAQRWSVKVRVLKQRVDRRVQIQRWNNRGNWRPLIKIASKRYHVNSSSLHRMMMLESGGRRYAGTMYRGLFQYHPATWRASWNPWRRYSIYNGWAQIQATAYAIRKGMGPSQWPHTYRMAF